MADGEKELIDESEEEEKKKKKKKSDDSKEAEMKANALRKELIESYQERLNSMGYEGPKINSVQDLKAQIAFYKEKAEKTAKTNAEADAKAKKIQVSNGNPSITMPNGQTIEADPYVERMNETPEAYFYDPLKAPKNLVKYKQDTRINYLPPTLGCPHNRIIA